MKEVLPDTNIILWTFSGGIDFREAIATAAPNFDIKIPTCVIDELKKLDTKKSKAALSFTSNMVNLTKIWLVCQWTYEAILQ